MKYIKLYEQVRSEHEVEHYPNRAIERETWYLDGKLHREEGPAEIGYYSNHNKMVERWYLNGKRHREDGPAWIGY